MLELVLQQLMFCGLLALCRYLYLRLVRAKPSAGGALQVLYVYFLDDCMGLPLKFASLIGPDSRRHVHK